MSALAEFFDTPSDRTDGYLRINTRTYRVSKVMHPVSGRGLVFVDIEGAPEPDIVTHAMQQEPLFTCDALLFRWPGSHGDSDSPSDRISDFLAHDALNRFLQDCGVARVGIVRFTLYSRPTVTWRQGADTSNDETMEQTLDRALRCEMRALLEYGHAIWRPTNYHYELPSGDHTDSFIRIADAFRTPRDVEVIATWFLDRLTDNIAIITDSASLVPLISEFRRLLSYTGADIAGAESLDSYPGTSLEIQQAIQSIGNHDALLAIMSVNASGRYKSLIFDAIRHAENPSLVVLIDKQNPGAARGSRGSTVSDVQLSSWVVVGEQGPADVDCPLCKQPGVAQVVRIDSRSFNAFALPRDNLVTPDVKAARKARGFFDICDKYNAIELNSPSKEYIREKQPPMGIKIINDRLIAEQIFREEVIERIAAIASAQRFDHIVVSQRESQLPGFEDLLGQIREGFATSGASVSYVPLTIHGADIDEDDKVARSKKPLIFCLGSVSGWLLRRLQMHVQNHWHTHGGSGEATAIVVHARLTTDRKWENLTQSFEGRLHALWRIYLPDSNPHADEFQLMEQSDIKAYVDANQYRHRDKLQRFFSHRLALCAESGEKVTDEGVLWFPTPESRVRNTSLYGTRIKAVTTFVAVASAVQCRRQEAQVTDPRWLRFDFVSIGRSYFDGLLIASMLRSCSPSEIWWGANQAQRQTNIEWLIRNTRDRDDQGILYSELIIAAAQGKIPTSAITAMCETIIEGHASWDESLRESILAALVLLSVDYPSLHEMVAEVDSEVEGTHSTASPEYSHTSSRQQAFSTPHRADTKGDASSSGSLFMRWIRRVLR